MKTFAEPADVVRSVSDTSADFADPASDVTTAEDEIVDEEALWYLRDLKSKDEYGPTAQQFIQEVCRTYGLSDTSDVRSVQEVIKTYWQHLLLPVTMKRPLQI